MLKKIEIQNYAIIDRLEIFFPDGLTIITGETGAGKSILLGALGLIMGKRADTKVLFDQDKKCYVEGTFDVSEYQLQDYFTEESLDYNDELIIRREIAPGGKSRAFVNDSPVTLDILHTLTDALIDIHQQFDILDIQKPVFQLQMIDALAGNKILLDSYLRQFKTYRQSIRKLEELKDKNRNATQEIEFLSFQLNEFNQADLKEGEQEDLEILLKKLTSAEDIKKTTTTVTQALEEDENAVISQMQALINQFASIRYLDKTYMEIYDRLISVREELADIAKEASFMADATEYDEEAIHQTNTRLNLINRLQKKHDVISMDDLLYVEKSIQQKLNGYADLTDEIQTIQTTCIKQESELRKLAKELTEKRSKVIASFEQNIHDLLVSLAMEHAYIKVNITPLKELGNSGLDDVSILFAPNKGSEFLPLKDTASGGEMSRLTLCIKSLVAGAITLPTLIFDEIDSGVSGEVAQKVGQILSNLSKKHQVICITHSPQIAAKAQSHFWVYKSDTKERTVTAMRELKMEDRIIEIAKMLSGNPPTETAKANARELIGKT
ncbi:MAG: DNA repair protein RecN [Saprospiraceae bacterium]|nr:DNA repair protein RecN [Saprospiraceae bacterium]